MARPRRNRRWPWAAALGCALLLPGGLIAAAYAGGSALPAEPLPAIAAAAWQPRAGDLVLRASRDVVGERIRAASGDAAIYSHVGLVVTRAGRPVIIDVTPYGSGLVEFSDVTAFTTRADTSDLLIMRPVSPLDQASLAAEAERLVAARASFDYDFNMQDRSELYCAELAYHLLERAGVDLSSVAWTDIYIPLSGDRRLVTPDALAHAPNLRPIFRRQTPL